MTEKRKDDHLIQMYRSMLTIRRFEERVSELFYQGRIPGFLHLCEGQEAAEVGACFPLRKDDCITVPHRGHGYYIAKGADLKRLMAEIYGKKTGYCSGRGGHMHIGVRELGIMGGYGIVGGGIPVAVGAALSAKMQGIDCIAVAFFGDGASNQGTFHECLNLASCWKLPVVFCCENNGWAVTTRIKDTCGLENISDRAAPYRMPGITVDGNDVLAVYRAARTAVERARKGEGPTLLECKTYRIRSHSEGLDAILKNRPYREKSEVDEWRNKDPIARFRSELMDKGVLSEELVKRIQEEVEHELAEAISYAEESALPAPEAAVEKVFE